MGEQWVGILQDMWFVVNELKHAKAAPVLTLLAF